MSRRRFDVIMTLSLRRVPAGYLKQYWPVINEVLRHSPEGNFTGNAKVIHTCYELINNWIKITAVSHRGQWVKSLFCFVPGSTNPPIFLPGKGWTSPNHKWWVLVSFHLVIWQHTHDETGPHFQYTGHLFRYRDFYYWDKMVMGLSYLYNRDPHTGKVESLYWSTPCSICN